jgi:hypothetical protein
MYGGTFIKNLGILSITNEILFILLYSQYQHMHNPKNDLVRFVYLGL